jgi:hypothetical protein
MAEALDTIDVVSGEKGPKLLRRRSWPNELIVVIIKRKPDIITGAISIARGSRGGVGDEKVDRVIR